MSQAKWVDTGVWKKDEAKPVDNETIKKLMEELKKAGIQFDEFKKPNKTNPQPQLPRIWTVPPRGHELDEDWEKKQEEENLVRFMQECRERTTDMKDSEKCERCKLRFRCYTEIKVEKKRKTKTRKPEPTFRTRPPLIIRAQIAQKIEEQQDWIKQDWKKEVDGIFNNYTKSNTKTESDSSNH